MNVWVLPLFGDRKAFPFLPAAPFRRGQGRISPDGKWVAFTTNEFGQFQIVVQAFPDPNGGKWQISPSGGIHPMWRSDGRELYYLAPDGKLMAVSIKGGDSLGNGMPSLLFQTPLDGQANPQATPYEATSDGQRFLMIDPITTAPTVALQADSAPITTIVNWTALLRKK